jgi:hypothetical protein
LQFLGDTGETNLYGLERPFGLLSQYTHQRLAGSLGVGSGGLVASPDLEPEDQDDRERKYCRRQPRRKPIERVTLAEPLVYRLPNTK